MESARRGFALGLLLATLLAGSLRFAGLGDNPVSIYCDEAFHAYEAYCLAQTGRDSRGVVLPFFFDIFGKGWGEPLYTYLTVPAVALFGLTPFAARFAAAAAGTLAVPATGLMTAALLQGSGAAWARRARAAGVAAALLMALSPWAFHLSRVAFQASLLPLMLAAGFWLAARGVNGAAGRAAKAHLVGASALLGLSLYTYTIARLAMPLLLAGFAWLHRRRLSRAARPAVAAAALLLIFILPIAFFTLTGQGRQRFSDVSLLAASEQREAGPVGIGRAALANYLSYYSPSFLLTQGDSNLRHSIRGHGMLHPHDLLLLILGAAGCLIGSGAGGRFLIWWLLAYPIAASLTVDPGHAVRSICGQPALYALGGAGAALTAEVARSGSRRGRTLLAAGALGLLLVASVIPVLLYFQDYFFDYPVYSGPAWQYGLKQAYDYADAASAGHDSIYVTLHEDFPFIQYLFYRAYPPSEYQAHRLSRTRYLFGEELFYRGTAIPGRANPVFVLKPFELPEGLHVRKRILYPDGTDAFVIAW